MSWEQVYEMGVSFSIKAGQLVVIVGPNGSEKSTIVKMLNRLYGEVLLGQPMNSYRIFDLRQATADLTQDRTLYRENIGLRAPSLGLRHGIGHPISEIGWCL